VRSFYLPEVILYHDEEEAQEVPCLWGCDVPVAPGIRCLDCEMKQAQDEKERARVRTLAWAAYHAEHGEPLSLGEAAAMADAMGMSYGAYSLQLSQQKRNVAIK
jgi:hypothetical protein